MDLVQQGQDMSRTVLPKSEEKHPLNPSFPAPAAWCSANLDPLRSLQLPLLSQGADQATGLVKPQRPGGVVERTNKVSGGFGRHCAGLA